MTTRHGFSIGIERHNQDVFLRMKAYGKLTHEDYEQMTPLLEKGLTGISRGSVKVFLDVTELDGWEPRAAWDDLKLALKEGSKFGKIAMVGSRDWQKKASSLGNWFISGELNYFEDSQQALDWLKS